MSVVVESDLSVQRAARRAMLSAFAQARGAAEIAPKVLRIAGGVAVQVDGATQDESLIVELEASQDPADEGRRARIGQALSTLALVRRERPEAQLVLLVPDEDVRDAAQRWCGRLAALAQVEITHCA